MKKLDIKIPTIARMGALLIALINQGLAIFGHTSLPFTENMAYQVISLVATIIVAAINSWYNNDITLIARLAGSIFQALSDGTITEKEIEDLLSREEDQ